MVRGQADSEKTILSVHFLQQGVDEGETALFINLEEDVRDLKANAAALGFDTDAIEFLDLSPSADVFVEEESYEVFEPAEVEREPLTEWIVEGVTAVDPDRVVVDPLTQLRFLLSDDYQFRKQVVGFMRFLKDRGSTTRGAITPTGSPARASRCTPRSSPGTATATPSSNRYRPGFRRSTSCSTGDRTRNCHHRERTDRGGEDDPEHAVHEGIPSASRCRGSAAS